MISNARTSRFSKKLETTGRSFVSRTTKKERSKETKTDVPELDFISTVRCVRGRGRGARGMKRELLMTKKPTSCPAARVRTFLSLIPFYLFFSPVGWNFPSGRGMAGGDKDHVKTRFQRQNRLYCPILKFLSAW